MSSPIHVGTSDRIVPRTLVAGVLALCVASPAVAQESSFETSPSGASLANHLESWRAEHGADWRLRTARRTGHLELLYGGNARGSFEPDTSDESDWFRLAREHVTATRALHGVELDELEDTRFLYMPLGQGTTTDKITVRLDQVIGGVPVEDGRINALFDTAGRLLTLHSTAAPEVEGRGARPAFDGAFASLIAREAFASSEGFEPDHYDAPELVYAWVDDAETRRWTLAWQVNAQYLEPGFQPRGWVYTIDARTRQVLKREASVHEFDVTGTVVANASPGTTADHSGNPPAQIPLPNLRVATSAGTVVTDANGQFTIPGVNVPVDVTLTFDGPYANVNNDAGADYSVTIPGVQPNQPNTLVMNPSPTEFVTSQANAFLHRNVQRDWIRSLFPTDSTADFLAPLRVNESAFVTQGGTITQCNAVYTGNETVYMQSGSQCNNTAFAPVVAHEMGHWMNNRYGTGNGSDGMGEGNADVFALYMYDDPVMGRFFFRTGGAVRNGTNNRQYCGDGNGGCHGGVHANGEVWMGAAWKVRTRLNSSLGNSMGDLTSNLLFLGWLNSYNQSQIDSVIELQWLALDDDDGTLSNGTPNFAEIDGGFRQQGFPGVDIYVTSPSGPNQLANTTDELGPYVVQATLLANLNPPVTQPEVVFRTNGGGTQRVPMAALGGDLYEGLIPGQVSPSVVEYYLEARDAVGNTAQFPEEGFASALEFTVGQLAVITDIDFESGSQGWSNGGGNASTGQWQLGDPVGTSAQPEDDHTVAPGTRCWVTGISASSLGSNDVDNGSTILLSPSYDLSALPDAEVSYWRWYSNDEGNSPNADVFLVEISPDGGSSWATVEAVGPTGPQSSGGWFQNVFRVDSFFTPSSSVRLRFTASDLGSGSIVEAAIDDVRVYSLTSSIPAPVSFCTPNPNSTGLAGSISFEGSQRIAANDARLVGQDFPPGAFGLFFFGDQQVQVPIMGQQGVLCVAGNTLRLPIIQTDGLFGTVYYDLDFQDPGTNAQAITPGTAWNFQFWHRDAVGGVATSNTSQGLEVQFE